MRYQTALELAPRDFNPSLREAHAVRIRPEQATLL